MNGVATRIVWPPSRWGKLPTQLPVGRNPFVHTSVNTRLQLHSVSDTNDLLGTNISEDREENNDRSLLPGSFSRTSNEQSKPRTLRTHLPKNSLGHASDDMAAYDE